MPTWDFLVWLSLGTFVLVLAWAAWQYGRVKRRQRLQGGRDTSASVDAVNRTESAQTRR